MPNDDEKQTPPDMSPYAWIGQQVYDGLMERAIKAPEGSPPEAVPELLPVSPRTLYDRARSECMNALLIGRRDINRLSTFNLRLGDDVRADAEEYIGRLEQIMAILEEVK
jgi:hypothetical protein